MDLHFRAFSFVDRITSTEPGTRIAGRYTIPATLTGFPTSLVAEATGQLAAWAAMAAVEFTHRPVAGLAGRVELLSEVRPGQVLELAADIKSVDCEAVDYGGTASVAGIPVLRLHHCVGPMMPLGEFDDPQLVRQRFALLKAEGAVPGGFEGAPNLALESKTMVHEDAMHAALVVPETAALFADHFLRRPVFPGTLLTHANLRLAGELMQRVAPSANGSQWIPRVISDVKLRSFIAPGETLELEARRKDTSADAATVAMQIRRGGKRVGSCRVDLAREAAK